MPAKQLAIEYDVVAILPSGAEIWLRPYMTQMMWEEVPDEIAMRLQVTLAAVTMPNGQLLHEAIPLGARLHAYVFANGVPLEIGRFTVLRWNYQDDGAPVLALTAYDDLFQLQRSDYERLYLDEPTGVQVLQDVFAAWNLRVGRVDGPSAVKMPRRYKAEGSLIRTINDVTGIAFRGGDDLYFPRMMEGAIEVVRFGTNPAPSDVLDGRYILSLSDDQDATDIVTQVEIRGSKAETLSGPEDPARPSMAQTLNGRLDLGRFVKIINGSQQDTPATLQEEAQLVLFQNGEPKRVRSLNAIDWPLLRKGDVITARAGTLDGVYPVVGVTHNALTQTMDLTIDSSGTLQFQIRRVDNAAKTKLAEAPEYAALAS
jgi:hypothetical protein